ncbi:Demethylmenaquinone methyltransferase [subsurface metagenome]
MATSQKYDRASRNYDRMESFVERLFFRRFREQALSHARGDVLEVGVGTGKNLHYYPSELQVTAVDFSSGMLERAHEQKEYLGLDRVTLMKMDVEDLKFPDASFDTVISTFVFCTVPDPLKGLTEVYRVLRPGGKAVFLEHMKSRNPLVNLFLGLMNLYSRPVLGTSMLRRTQENITTSGFNIILVNHLLLDVVRLIVTEKTV